MAIAVSYMLQCLCLQAVQVMKTCTNSKGQEVLANVVLFNVTLSSKRFGKRGFTGTSANGVRHTFHVGDTTAQFSSRLGDNKSFPADFFDHITFPQKARVYFSPGKECQVEGLEHLCIVEFTGRHEQDFVDIKSNVDDPESHDYQSIPLGLDIVVSLLTACTEKLFTLRVHFLWEYEAYSYETAATGFPCINDCLCIINKPICCAVTLSDVCGDTEGLPYGQAHTERPKNDKATLCREHCSAYWKPVCLPTH